MYQVSPSEINQLSALILKHLAGLAALGTLSMAFIQVLKNLFPFRQVFNQGFLWTWFRSRLQKGGPRRSGRVFGWRRGRTGTDLDHRVDEALEQVYDLATGGHRLALLDLGVEQLCGQLNAAAQVALEYPARYKAFVDVLVAGADPHDVQILREGNPVARALAHNQKVEGVPEGDKQRYFDARARIGHFAQRTVDAVHIRLEARWQWWLQWAGFGFSSVLAFTALNLWPDENAGIAPTHWYVALFWSFLGGFLAPVAHDLVAAIKSRS